MCILFVHVSDGFQKKVWMGWVGGLRTILFFLDFLNFFNFARPLIYTSLLPFDYRPL